MSSILEYLRQVPLPDKTTSMLSVQWWLEYLLKTYQEDPYHVLVELLCLGIILWLLFRPKYDPQMIEKLSAKEEEELIAEWTPEPLVPELKEMAKIRRQLVVESASEAHVIVDGEKYLNFASHSFAGMANLDAIKKACADCIDKYGVGTCGPRGFYGTLDVHLQLEKDISSFYGTGDTIVYSDGMALVSSVIPAFLKKGDLIVCDEGVHYGVKQGILLSRSNVLYFKHNDMEDLEAILEDVREQDLVRGPKELNRRWIIVEGIYQNHGDICPLRQVADLKKKYRYRVMLDDSYAITVLGKTGRGTPEHWDVPVSDIEAIMGVLDTGFSSVGGFCTGLKQVVDHQRLSGAGYVFSASAPTYTAVAASKAMEILLNEPQRCQKVRDNARSLRGLLDNIDGIQFGSVDSVSPLIHIRLERSFGTRDADEAFLRIVEEKMLSQHIAVHVPQYIPQDTKPAQPSLKVCVTSLHTDEHLEELATKLREAFEWAFSL